MGEAITKATTTMKAVSYVCMLLVVLGVTGQVEETVDNTTTAETTFTPTDENPVAPEDFIMTAVAAEEFMSRTYLDLVLKIQRAFLNKKAAMSMMMLSISPHSAKKHGIALPLLEEDNEVMSEDENEDKVDSDDLSMFADLNAADFEMQG